MDLKEPKRKRVSSHIKPKQQFPILIESEINIPVENELWPLYIGRFAGDCVVVSDPEDMTSLYTMGFFGKGSMSRGYPSFEVTKEGIPPIIKERQWQRRQSWMEKMKSKLSSSVNQQPPDKSKESVQETIEKSKSECIDESNDKQKDVNSVTHMDVDVHDNELSKGMSLSTSDPALDVSSDLKIKEIEKESLTKSEMHDNIHFGREVLVLADSDSEDIEKVLKTPEAHVEVEQMKMVYETLNLTLEEAFFLSYALGCLHITDISGEPMTLEQQWNRFIEVKTDFIECYVAYHYFRAKGWVVKSGYKFGGEFLLYKQGPSFYHASYVVIIEKVDDQLRKLNDDVLTWTKLHGLNRLAENSGKDIITCQVVFPDSLNAENLKSPKSLPRFQVNELLTRRWIESQEREEKEIT